MGCEWITPPHAVSLQYGHSRGLARRDVGGGIKMKMDVAGRTGIALVGNVRHPSLPLVSTSTRTQRRVHDMGTGVHAGLPCRAFSVFFNTYS